MNIQDIRIKGLNWKLAKSSHLFLKEIQLVKIGGSFLEYAPSTQPIIWIILLFG